MYADVTDTDHIVMLHSIAGMSVEETESSLRLFSREVLPVVKAEIPEARLSTRDASSVS